MMSIELNKFIQHAQNDKVSLQSNQQGDPVLSSGGSLKGKVVKMLSVVGLDKNQFVENYKAQKLQSNLQTTGAFLHALQKHYGSDIAQKISSHMDLSGTTALSGRLIQQYVDAADDLKQRKDGITALNAAAAM